MNEATLIIKTPILHRKEKIEGKILKKVGFSTGKKVSFEKSSTNIEI